MELDEYELPLKYCKKRAKLLSNLEIGGSRGSDSARSAEYLVYQQLQCITRYYTGYYSTVSTV